MRIGGSVFSLFCWVVWIICCCSVWFNNYDCFVVLIGKELYLNGLNLGVMFSQVVWVNVGKMDGSLVRLVKWVNVVMLIIGDSRMICCG